MEDKARIYIITFPDGKRYVGQTKLTVAERWLQHVRSGRTLVDHVIRILGPACLIVEEIWEGSISKVLEIERRLIHICGTAYPQGYNFPSGAASPLWKFGKRASRRTFHLPVVVSGVRYDNWKSAYKTLQRESLSRFHFL